MPRKRHTKPTCLNLSMDAAGQLEQLATLYELNKSALVTRLIGLAFAKATGQSGQVAP